MNDDNSVGQLRGAPRRSALVVLLVVAPLLAAVLPAQRAAADTPTCVVSAILVNSCRPWLGGTALNYPQVASDKGSQLQYLETRMGRQLDIAHTYHGVGDNTLSSTDIAFATRPDTMLFTDWKPTDTWGAIDSQNAAIDQMAASIRSLGSTRIFMTLYHEPENEVSPGGDANCPKVKYKGTLGTVAEYRHMWQYVEDRFAADGVSNVVWVMDYMNYPAWDCLVPDLYPGDNLVNWIMFNGYQSTASDTFPSIVGHFYDLLTNETDSTHAFTSKPWGIAEWNAKSSGTSAEEAYYQSAQAALDKNIFPRLKAYLVFDQNDKGATNGTNERVGYDDNGTYDPAKGAYYYAFADDPLLEGSYESLSVPDTTSPSVTLNTPSNQSTVTGDVTVSGTASDDTNVASVHLLVDGVDSAQSTSRPSGSAVSLTWDSTTVSPGPHTLALEAVDEAGNIGSSNTAAVTVVAPDTTPPTAPILSSVTANGSAEADLSWEASSDDVGVSGYQILRNGNVLTTVAGDTSSYQDLTVSAGESYSYDVVAVDAAGNTSEASNTLSVSIPSAADTTPPSVPTGVTATATGAHQILVSWQASTDNVGVTGYDVYRGGTEVSVVSSGLSLFDTPVGDATTYSYTVAAVDGTGNTSAQSVAATVTTPDGTAPTIPGNLKASLSSSRTAATLSWNAATDNVSVVGYIVYRNGTRIGAATGATAYTDTHAPQGRTDKYTVASYDAAGNISAQSVAATVAVPDTTAPTAPTNLKLTPGSKNVTLTWTASTDNVAVVGYYVSRNGTKVATVTSGTSYIDKGLKTGTRYNYSVVAYDAAGNLSKPSAVQSAAPRTATALWAVPGSSTAQNELAQLGLSLQW